jgi:TRAP transporter TAXI family solute receptor
MRKKAIGSIFMLFFLIGCISQGHADQTGGAIPKRLSIGTSQAGGLWYAMGSSFAKVINDHSKIRADVKPFGGSTTYYPLVNSGEVEMGVNNAIDLSMAYLGPEKYKIAGRNFFRKSPNLRLVMRGSPIKVAMWVKRDSDIETARDLRGRKVTGEYPAQLGIWFWTYAYMLTCGLSWEDVKVVPVPNFAKGIQALVEGRADSCLSAPGIAKLKEAHAAVGIRMIPICNEPQGIQNMQKAIPAYYPILIKAGSYKEIDEDLYGLATDIYLYTHKNFPASGVKEVLRSLWDYNKDLAPLHPFLKEWTTERAASTNVTIPYHPGAVTFYKEKGVWNTEMDQRQSRLLRESE